MTKKTSSEIYQKMTPIEHILKRPDTYVGSVQPENIEIQVPSFDINSHTFLSKFIPAPLESLKMERKKLVVVPAFMKIFDEILVNAADNKIRDPNMTTISITVDPYLGKISILNDGKGIPVEIHAKEKVYIPKMIFGQLLTSSNYDDDAQKVTGGRNGYGAKLTNLYSKEFVVTTRNARNCAEYKQTWKNNMKDLDPEEMKEFSRREFKAMFESRLFKEELNENLSDTSFEEDKKSSSDIIKEPTKQELKRFQNKIESINNLINENLTKKLETSKSQSVLIFNEVLKEIFPSFTEVEFTPDLQRFGMTSFDSDTLIVLAKRACDLAGSTEKTCQVILNGQIIPIDSFESYMDLFLSNGAVKVFERVNSRWSVGVTASDGHFQHISFVNSIFTPVGGKHVSHVSDNLVNKLCDELQKRTKRKQIRKAFVKNQLFVFVNCLISNPAFKSQTKEFLSSDPRTFGSKCDLSNGFIKKILDSEILEQINSYLAFREHKELKKTDGKKSKRIFGLPKLVDAHKAGTKESHKCHLILTEGDSAKQLALSGLSVVGQDYFGIFPLRGKMLNVREANKEQLIKNAEVEAVKKIIGLKIGQDYSNNTEEGAKNYSLLRYGKIIIMADQDLDGSHIKGLIINFIHFFWPSLIRRNDFLYQMITPIVVATLNSSVSQRTLAKDRKLFYSVTEFNRWREEVQTSRGAGSWTFKYYKGLGTSDAREGKEYFKNLSKNLKPFRRESEEDEKKIEMAFEKKMIAERKNWLIEQYKDDLFVDLSRPFVSYCTFVDFELINFSMHDAFRSIPAFIDGLKPVQRKILYTALFRGLKRDMKVSTFAAAVSQLTNYHHGEMSLYKAIIGMAQNFTGSNNLNLLVPAGQFGSRNKLGKDAASPRYIHTRLEPITAKLFPIADLPVLEYKEEDGEAIEPKFFVPILPLVLLNGAEGIGTGWSTKISCYNPKEVLLNVRNFLARKELVEMQPWFRGFTGKIESNANGGWNVSATVEMYENSANEIVLEVSEPSLFRDMDDLKEKYDKLVQSGFLIDFVSNCLGAKTTFSLILGESAKAALLTASAGEEKWSANLKEVLRTFYLTSSISGSNMVLFDMENKPVKFQTVFEIIEQHATIRLQLYEKRKAYLIATIKEELRVLSNKTRFILDVNAKKIVLNNRKKTEIEKELEEKGFDKLLVKTKKRKETTDEEPNIISGNKANFDYLLQMRLSSLTFEKVEELLKQHKYKEKELEVLIATKVEALWHQELDEFEEEYARFERAWFDDFQESLKKTNQGKRTKHSAVNLPSDKIAVSLEEGESQKRTVTKRSKVTKEKSVKSTKKTKKVKVTKTEEYLDEFDKAVGIVPKTVSKKSLKKKTIKKLDLTEESESMELSGSDSEVDVVYEQSK